MIAQHCPFCGSPDICELLEPDSKGRDCVCLDCEKVWKDGGR